MKQQTLALAGDLNQGFEQYRHPTRRDVFLSMMEKLVPWFALIAVIEPHYPKRDNGRPPVGLERMLRMDSRDLSLVKNWRIVTSLGTEPATSS